MEDNQAFEFGAPQARLVFPNPTLNSYFPSLPTSAEGFRSISVDELLMRGEQESMWQLAALKRDPTVRSPAEFIARLTQLLAERIELDQYLAPTAFRAESMRLHALKRFTALQRENFLRALENAPPTRPKRNVPRDEELLLNAFVCCICEFDDTYLMNAGARQMIFVEGFLRSARKLDSGFTLEVSRTQISCNTPDVALSFPFAANGVFSLLAFLTFFVHQNHKDALRDVHFGPPNAFKELMRRFDVSP